MSRLESLLQLHPVRRTDKEKEAFREYVKTQFAEKEIEVKTETTGDGKNRNLVIGDPLTAKVVCTAHYDTPAASLFPNLMIPRNKPLFLLYQFVPITLMLALAIGGGYLIASAVIPERSSQEYMALFLCLYLLIYYVLFFLMYRAFKNPNNYNDNTSGVAAVLALVDELTEEQRKNVAFILFDNEEKGKKGSKAYYKDHKEAMEKKFLINFDCVGNGEHIIFIAMKEAEKCESYQKLRDSFTAGNGYQTYFFPMKGSESNSDYKNFPCGIGCMASRQTKGGLFYTPYIHTPRDTVAKEENIRFIADGMGRFFSML